MVAKGTESRGSSKRARTSGLAREVRQAHRSLKDVNRELRRRVQQLRVLHRVSLAMNLATWEPHKIWKLVLDEALKLFQAKTGVIFLLEEGGTLRAEVIRGRGRQRLRDVRIPVGKGIVGHVAQAAEPVIVPDVRNDPRYLLFFPDVRSEMTVPMLSGKTILGVLNLESPKLNAFGEADLEVAMILASHAARVWENRRFYRMTEERSERLEESYRELRATQAQLIAKGKLAALGEMAAIVAHEIRNPLTSVRGFAQRMSRGGQNEKTLSRYGRIIMDEVDRLDGVIKNVLDFAGQSELSLERVEPTKPFDSALRLCREDARKKRIAFQKRWASRLPKVLMDPQQIQQVLLNVLRNAIEATPKGKAIEVRTGRRGDGIYYSIADEGPGLSPDVLGKLFQPFFTTRSHGTGLGLAIAQKIVDLHGGRIQAENRSCGGAKFTVWVPRRPLVITENAPPKEKTE